MRLQTQSSVAPEIFPLKFSYYLSSASQMHLLDIVAIVLFQEVSTATTYICFSSTFKLIIVCYSLVFSATLSYWTINCRYNDTSSACQSDDCPSCHLFGSTFDGLLPPFFYTCNCLLKSQRVTSVYSHQQNVRHAPYAS